MIEEIKNDGTIYAIIIRNEYSPEGIEFLTPNHFSQQLGIMRREMGYKIQPHIHNKVNRKIDDIMEVLFIKKGKIKVTFYDNNKNFVCDNILQKGDVILLACGGHGFEMLEDSEIIEVKQGPFVGDNDKTRF